MSEKRDRSRGDLPVVDTDDPRIGRDGAVDDRDGTADDAPAVAGVLLAAGRSTRFGPENKLLADLGGRPVVARAARTLLAADLSAVVAVVGHEADRVAAAVRGARFGDDRGPGDGHDSGDGRDSGDGPEGTADPGAVDGSGRLAVVGNPDYAAGQSTSVRAGVRAVRGADAAVFALGDMPLVRPATVDRLVAAYRAGAGEALAAAHDGRRGNPTLFDARHFPALADVEGDTGGREILLSGEHSALVETGDPGVLRDLDTPEDVERAR